MKKGLILALCLALALILPVTALADIRRGDQGDDVYELQMLLWKCGWIFEEPDGVFGKHTEDALKKYQRYAGFEADGVASDDVMRQLRYDYAVLFNLPLPEDGPAQPTSCVVGESGEILCSDHSWVEAAAYDLMYAHTPDYASAARLWVEAIEELYAEWLAGAEDAEKLAVMAAFGKWRAEEENQREALKKQWPGQKNYAAEQMALWYRAQTAALCETVRGGADAGDETVESGADDGEGQGGEVFGE